MEVKVFPRESFLLVVLCAQVACLTFWVIMGLTIATAGFSALLIMNVWLSIGKYWLIGWFYMFIFSVPIYLKMEIHPSRWYPILGATLSVVMTVWNYWEIFPAADDFGEELLRNGVLGGYFCSSFSSIINYFIVVCPAEKNIPAESRQKSNEKNIITK